MSKVSSINHKIFHRQFSVCKSEIFIQLILTFHNPDLPIIWHFLTRGMTDMGMKGERGWSLDFKSPCMVRRAEKSNCRRQRDLSKSPLVNTECFDWNSRFEAYLVEEGQTNTITLGRQFGATKLLSQIKRVMAINQQLNKSYRKETHKRQLGIEDNYRVSHTRSQGQVKHSSDYKIRPHFYVVFMTGYGCSGTELMVSRWFSHWCPRWCS